MRSYCSLWDRNYCAKGLALYKSLRRHSSEPFELHILAMDEATLKILRELELPDAWTYSLEHFECSMKLTGIKNNRSWAEYCWTCASSFMEYLLNRHDRANDFTYLDADLFFFSDPKVVFDEIGKRSIGITPHRFSPDKKYLEANGLFNVGWVTARGEVGVKCIAKWAAECREKCSLQDGCGDQKYLDSWPAEYGDDLCVIENPGVNLAPWNLPNYKLSTGPRVEVRSVVFYHFHEFQDEDHLTNYRLRLSDIALLYQPYIAEWRNAKKRMEQAEKMIAARHSDIERQAERA